MSKLQEYITQFGPEAGRSLYHIYRSRAAHKGVSTKRRLLLEELTGRRFRNRRKSVEERGQLLLPLTEPVPPGTETTN
jgi:hypothetical protein